MAREVEEVAEAEAEVEIEAAEEEAEEEIEVDPEEEVEIEADQETPLQDKLKVLDLLGRFHHREHPAWPYLSPKSDFHIFG